MANPSIKALAQANKLTNARLVKGVIEAIVDRGTRQLTGVVPAKPYTGSTYDFVQEATLSSASTSVYDPYDSSTGLSNSSPTYTRFSVATKSLGLNADTAKIDVIGKSDINDQRASDVLRTAKKLGEDWVTQCVRGANVGNQMYGMDGWIDYYSASLFTEADYNAAGANLSTKLVQELRSRNKGDDFDVLYTNRASFNGYREVLNGLGGNAGAMIMDETFGMAVLMYDGIPIVILDVIDDSKTVTGLSAVGTTTDETITSLTTDNGFPGFSKADIGKSIDDGDANTTTIASWTSGTVVTLTNNTGFATDDVITVASANLMYAVRFDTEDGFTWVYHRDAGDFSNDMGEHFASIAGFSARDLGLLEDYNIHRVRLDVFGNFVSHSPFALARMRNFAIA